MAGLAGKRALVRVAGAPVAFTDEATATTDDQVYTIVDQEHRFWDRTAAIVVEEGGTPVNPVADPYTLNRLLGQVIFENVDAGRGAITVSGQSLPTAVAAGARSYAYSLVRQLLDDTDFDNANDESGFVSKIAGLLEASGSIGRRVRVDDYFIDPLLAGGPVLLELYVDRDEEPDLLVWAVLSKEGLQAAIDGTQDADVEWVGTADADGNVVAQPA